MENENENEKNNDFSEKNSQEKLNSTISSDTIRILSLLNSYPSTATSSSFLQDKKQNVNSSNENNSDINNNIENLSYEEIKAICLRVFMLYAEPINGQFYLSQRYIFQILREMEILSPNCLSSIDIGILNQQVNKKGDKLDSEQFLDLLAKICCLLDDNFYKDKKGSFIKIIQIYIAPYLQKKEKGKDIDKNKINKKDKNKDMNYDIYENKNLNLNFKDLILKEYKLDKDSFDILISIIEGLKIIYITYFSLSEISSSNKPIVKIHKESFNIFIKFLKEFGFIPILLKQRLAELYWSIIISIDIKELYKIDNNNDLFNSFLNNKKYNLGKVYTFKKFFLLFSHLSFNYYYAIKSKTNGQKLLYLIEKIYRSKGYEKLPNVYSKTFSRRYSIIPPVNIVERINKNIIDEKIAFKLNLNNNNSEKETINYNNILELNESNNNMLKDYLELLKLFFDLYSHLYDRSIYGKMSFTNLKKMLSDGEILIINNNNQVGKENNLNTTNKKLDKTQSEEIKINQESSQNDILKDNNRYNNSNVNISENSNIMISSNISLDNKKLNSNFQSTQTLNKTKLNKTQTKGKIKILDLNLIISKVCHNPTLDIYNKDENSNISAKTSYIIDFILFLKTLSLISLKIYPNENNDINISMEQFLKKDMEDFLSKLNQKSIAFMQNNEIHNLFEFIINNNNIVQLMNDISFLIKGHFDYYAEIDENKIQIFDFNSFLRFFKEYEIFPIWINLTTLHEIFYAQIFRISKENQNFLKISEKINFPQFLECFVVVGVKMNSGDDFDMIDKILFMLDKMFSDNYGKVIKKIKNIPSFKEDYLYYEKILKEKYPSYYERKYSNCNHRYDNKFYWVFEKNYEDNNSRIQQINFGELFNREKVKFNDMFGEIKNNDNKNQTYNDNEPINELNED